MDTTFTGRPYAGLGDLKLLREFVSDAARARGPQPAYLHPGDLTWGLFANTVFDPHANIRLWRSAEGRLLGFAWLDEPDELELALDPRLPFDAALADEMLAWGEERLREQSADGTLAVSAIDDDDERIAFLTGRGLSPIERHNVLFRRDLDDLPGPSLGTTFEIRAVTGLEEYPRRVALHREVWDPSRVTLEAYTRLRDAPGYERDLDIVAVTPGGRFASYCICWLDPVSATGEFEPVGTGTEFRRRGLARAVIFEGLRRMRSRGMRSATVLTASFNDAALALYESAGFAVVGHKRFYARPAAA